VSPHLFASQPRQWIKAGIGSLALLIGVLTGLAIGQQVREEPQDNQTKPSVVAATNSLSLLNGAVTVTSSDPDVELSVAQNGKLLKVIDKKAGQEIAFDTEGFSVLYGQGSNRVQLSGDKLIVWRGETAIAEIRRQLAAPQQDAKPSDDSIRPGAQRKVISGDVSPDGKTLVAACSDRTLRAWDIDSGKEIRIHRWDTTSRRETAEQASGKNAPAVGVDVGAVYNKEDRVQAIRFVAEGRDLLVLTTKQLTVLDPITLRYRRTRACFAGSVQASALSADGREMLTGGRGQLHVWNVPSGHVQRPLPHHMDIVTCVAISNDGRRGFCGGAYFANSDTPVAELARVWDLETGEVLFQLSPKKRTGLHGDLSPDGSLVAAPNLEKGKDLSLWDIATGRELRSLPIHASIRQVHFSPNGERIVTQESSGKLQVFTVKTGEQIAEFAEPLSAVQLLTWAPDSLSLVISDGQGARRLALPKMDSAGEPVISTSAAMSPELRRTDLDRSPGELAFTSDGKSALIGPPFGRTLCLIDVETGRVQQRFSGVSGSHMLRAIAISPDNKLALIGGGQSSGTQRLTLWDLDAWKPVRVFEGLESLPECVAFTPSGREALCGTTEGNVHVWNVETAKPLAIYRSGVREARGLAVAAEGRLAAFAGGGLQSRLDLWSVVTGEKVKSLADDAHRPFRAFFTPDAKSLISAGDDRTIRVWNVDSGRLLRTMRERPRIKSAALSPDGKNIVVGCDDGAVAIWNVENGQELVRYASHTAPVTAVSFTSEPRYILSASDDRSIRRWPLPSAKAAMPQPPMAPERRDEKPPALPPPGAKSTSFEQRQAMVQRNRQTGEIYSIYFTQSLTDDDWTKLSQLATLRTLGLPRSMRDQDFAHLQNLSMLRALHLSGKLSDTAVHEIAGLSWIQLLSAFDSGLTDKSLAEWNSLAKLQDLTLYNTRITDEGLKHLERHFALHSLALSRSLITGSGLKHLTSLVELKRLTLDDSPITNEGLRSIVELQSLTAIRLNQCIGLGDEGLRQVATLPKLSELHLRATSISDAGLDSLKGLKHLKTLGLPATRITDAGLKHLYELSELETLDLTQVNVSEAAVAELRKQLPKLRNVVGYQSSSPKKD
jgi:WD40 repeat protein